MVGGRDFLAQRFSGSAHVFDTVTLTWCDLLLTHDADPERAPKNKLKALKRTGHAATAVPGGILIFGGLNNREEYLRDAAFIDLF